ncbi:MAG: DUF899 family protein [Bryobacterales bacterium]|nr:DUF899 family protein [Bryobacterales bacterium]
MTDIMRDEPGGPQVVDRSSFQAELDTLRIREKAHTHEGDVIAAARRRLPMVEMDPSIALIGPNGPVTLLDAFEGSRQLVGYYFMWHTGHPAPEQCEGCTWVTTQVSELSYLHSRDATFAVFCQGPTRKARGTAISWAGRCPGTRRWVRSKHSWLDATWAGCTSFATCGRDPKSSRLTGRRRGVSR